MKIVELYEGTLFECQMIKNLLENEGIESQLTDEIMGSRAGAAWRTNCIPLRRIIFTFSANMRRIKLIFAAITISNGGKIYLRIRELDKFYLAGN
jgi:hypothetical protein